MYWIIKKKDARQWRKKFAIVPRKINECLWIWLESYEERLKSSRWLSSDGSVPPDHAAAFDFERRCSRGVGAVTKYLSD